MSTRREFIARDRTHAEVAAEIGADAVIYQTLDDLVGAVTEEAPRITRMCTACFSGKLPDRRHHLEDAPADRGRAHRPRALIRTGFGHARSPRHPFRLLVPAHREQPRMVRPRTLHRGRRREVGGHGRRASGRRRAPYRAARRPRGGARNAGDRRCPDAPRADRGGPAGPGPRRRRLHVPRRGAAGSTLSLDRRHALGTAASRAFRLGGRRQAGVDDQLLVGVHEEDDDRAGRALRRQGAGRRALVSDSRPIGARPRRANFARSSAPGIARRISSR